jgi:hypothetical protein
VGDPILANKKNVSDEQRQVLRLERRRQVRGLLLLACAALGFALVRAMMGAGVHRVFGVGWWRLW